MAFFCFCFCKFFLVDQKLSEAPVLTKHLSGPKKMYKNYICARMFPRIAGTQRTHNCIFFKRIINNYTALISIYTSICFCISVFACSHIFLSFGKLQKKSQKIKIAISISTEPPPTGALTGWETEMSRGARRPEHRSGYLQRKQPPLNTFAEMNIER